MAGQYSRWPSLPTGSAPVNVTVVNPTGSPVNTAIINSGTEIAVVDTVDHGGLDTVLVLSSTPVEGKVGAVRLPDRKYVWIQGISTPGGPSNWIDWGFSASTQSFKLFKDQLLVFPIGENTQIWFKVVSGSGSVAFGEGA